MDISCYTVRPGPDSGWLTFFELARAGKSSGFFLVLGPAECPPSGPDPEHRRIAQETARGIVAVAKALRDPGVGDWIEEVARRVAAAPAPLEFGAMMAGEDSLHFRVEGRVRVVPVVAGARRRWERDVPRPGENSTRRVEAGDRFFFGRVPREAAAGLPPADLLEGIERGGAGDGALMLTVHSVRGITVAAAAPEPARAVPAPAAFAEPAPAAPAPTLPVGASDVEHGPLPPPDSVGPPEPPDEGLSAPPVEVAPPLRAGTRSLRHRARAAPAAWAVLALALAALGTYLFWLRPGLRAPRPAERGGEVSAGATATGSSTIAPGDRPGTKAPSGAPAAPAPQPGAAESPGVAWEARLPGAVTGAPLAAGGRIIVGCRDGGVYGLTPDSGKVAWRLAGQKGFGGAAAVRDSVACIGGFDGVVRAFDPASGRSLWQYATAGRIRAAPVFNGDGQVIAVSYDHTVYALEVAGGRLAWKRRLDGILWATPALGQRYLFVPGLDGVLSALNPRRGTVAWRFKAGGEIYSAPVATDSLVVFGCDNGTIYALDARRGILAWRVAAGRPVGGGACAAGGLFLLGDDGGTLHAIEAATGRERWTYRTGAAIKSTPLVDGSTVVLSSHDGALHAVNLATGEPIGRVPLDAPMASSPLIVGDSLYVGTHDGRVVALRLR